MPRFRSIALVIVLLSAVVSAGQQASPKPPAAAAAPSSARFNRLDAVLQEHIDQNRIAGIVVLVLKDGKPIYERALGWSDMEAKRPMKADTIFRIASQTKALDERGDPVVDGGRTPHAQHAREPVHPGVCQDDGGGER